MASETFVSAMMLITGVVAASILIVAVLPMIWGMVGTFSSASAATDRSMRTDFKIVTTYARYTSGMGYQPGANVSVWMKNIGTARIGTSEFKSADVLVGRTDNFGLVPLRSTIWPFQRVTTTGANSVIYWYYALYEPQATINNNFWDPGETLQVDTFTNYVTASGQTVYFQFTLPSGGSRSAEFTVMAQ